MNNIPLYRRAIRKLVYISAPLLNDKVFVKINYWCNFGRRLNLNHPTSFNEKIQWLKLYHKRTEFTKMVDKFEAKKFVANIIGKEHIIPTLGIWNKAEDIDFDCLPNQFVLKCTHDSGGVVICKDKSKLDKEEAINKLSKGLRQNFIAVTREYPYKNVIPRIIAEKYMVDESGYELKDYKIFCINGKAKFLFVVSERNTEKETTFDFYDTDWNHLPVMNGHPNNKDGFEKPKKLEQMLLIAEKIAKELDTPQVRIDLYDVKDKIYFGEITFFHNSGFVPFEPEEWDYKFGQLIELTK
jgi:hypothetical protein